MGNCRVNGHDAPHLPLPCAGRDGPWLRLAQMPCGQWDGRRVENSGGCICRIRSSEESATPDATVFYLLDQTFNTVSQKSKKGLDPIALAESILTCRTKNDRLRGSPDNRPFKNYSTRDNEETSLRMMITKAYELMDRRTDECVQKHGNANAAKSDLYVFGFRGSYLYRWEKNAWRVRSDAATVWNKDLESLVSLSDKVKVMVCGPGRSLDREGDQGVHMQKEIQLKVNTIRMNLIPVVSADAVSWGCEVDNYGRNKPVQRAWMVPAYLAAVPDFFSLTRTEWPGEVGLKIRDFILQQLKENTSSKMGDASSMPESEDAEMTSAGQGGPPIGGAPGGSSLGVGHQEESPATFPKAPPKALVTKLLGIRGYLSCDRSWEPVDFEPSDAQGDD